MPASGDQQRARQQVAAPRLKSLNTPLVPLAAYAHSPFARQSLREADILATSGFHPLRSLPTSAYRKIAARLPECWLFGLIPTVTYGPWRAGQQQAGRLLAPLADTRQPVIGLIGDPSPGLLFRKETADAFLAPIWESNLHEPAWRAFDRVRSQDRFSCHDDSVPEPNFRNPPIADLHNVRRVPDAR